MRCFHCIISMIVSLLCFSSCLTPRRAAHAPQGNFACLLRIMLLCIASLVMTIPLGCYVPPMGMLLPSADVRVRSVPSQETSHTMKRRSLSQRHLQMKTMFKLFLVKQRQQGRAEVDQPWRTRWRLAASWPHKTSSTAPTATHDS